MKKALIIAAVAAASLAGYYLYIKPGRTILAEQPAQISGTWKLDTITPAPGKDSLAHLMLAILPVVDSNFSNYKYQFVDSVTVYRLLNDRVIDTLSIQHVNNKFTWMVNGDTTYCTVLQFDSSRFVLQTADTTKLVFRKLAH
jgi:hypothetical protein